MGNDFIPRLQKIEAINPQAKSQLRQGKVCKQNFDNQTSESL